MTNKVKPFYIRITDDMTPQMVQDAFDKCVDAGAIPRERVVGTKTKHSYPRAYSFDFKLFGVSVEKQTLLQDGNYPFGGPDKEITLDQLDEWLGLEVEEDWDGKGLPPVGVECEILFKEYPHKGFGLFNVLAYHGGAIWAQYVGPLENNGKCYTAECSALEFRKPETPEQKDERERLEAAYDLYCDYCNGTNFKAVGFEHFRESLDCKDTFVAIVDKTNYRKQ